MRAKLPRVYWSYSDPHRCILAPTSTSDSGLVVKLVVAID